MRLYRIYVVFTALMSSIYYLNKTQFCWASDPYYESQIVDIYT